MENLEDERKIEESGEKRWTDKFYQADIVKKKMASPSEVTEKYKIEVDGGVGLHLFIKHDLRCLSAIFKYTTPLISVQLYLYF